MQVGFLVGYSSQCPTGVSPSLCEVGKWAVKRKRMEMGKERVLTVWRV